MISKSVSSFKLFSWLDWKSTFFRGHFLIYEVLSMFLRIAIYYFSSKAFVPNFPGTDLFSYLLWGELVLKIPQNLFSAPIQRIKQAIQENTLDSMILFSQSPKLIFFSLATMELFRAYLELILMFLIATLCFGLQTDLSHVWKLIPVQLAYLPVFLGVGFLLSAVVLFFERGENLLYSISNLLAVAAGMYFPISVFPEVFQKLVMLISPYTYFLTLNRDVISGGDVSWVALALSFVAGLVFCSMSLHCMMMVFEQKKKTGQGLWIG